MKLGGKGKFMKRDANGEIQPIGDVANFLPVNSLPASIFNSIEVAVNGLMVRKTHSLKCMVFHTFCLLYRFHSSQAL